MSFRNAVVFAIICSATPSAAAAARLYAFDIPAGHLGTSLVALGNQARVSIGVSDPALAAERVPALRGRMSVRQALDRLLKGSRAQPIFIDGSTIRIVRRPKAAPRRAAPPRAPAPIIESPPPPPIDDREIIITASRRAVPLSSYPGSVEIVGGDDPTLNGGLSGSAGLVGRLPGLTSTHLGPGRNKLFIRGMSESNFNGFTQATVGQYLGEYRLNYNAPDPDLRLHDVSRVEVLEGAQGTLYGAGSLGGIIRVVPNAPDLANFGLAAGAGVSTTAHGGQGGELSVAANIPLASDKSALRVGGYIVREAGYIDDTLRNKENVNRVHIAGGRAAIRFAPDDRWTVDLNTVGQKIRGDDAQYAEVGQPPLTRRSPLAQNHSNAYLLAGLAGRREGDLVDFTGSMSFVRQSLFERYDAVAIGNPLVAYDLTTDVRLFSGEARWAKSGGGGADWVLGAAIFNNSSDQERDVDFFIDRQRRNRVTSKVLEGALYGEAEFPVASTLAVTLGGRLSGAKVVGEGFVFRPGQQLPSERTKVERTEIRLLPSAGIAWRISPDALFYGRYQESFRPGGLSVGFGGIGRFDSDRVRSAEAGVRYGRPQVGRLDASIAVGAIFWKDIQADTLDLFAEPATVNIGDARNLFVDASIGWRPLVGWALDAGAVVVDSEIVTGPAKSFALPGVARFNGRLASHYSFALWESTNVRLSAAARYTGTSILGLGIFTMRKQGGWLDLDLSATATRGRHALTFGMTNLLDSRKSRFALGNPLLLGEREFTTPVRPRTARLTWELRY